MAEKIYLALGANMGDRWQSLQKTAAALPPAVAVLRASPVFETPPWGYLDQPAFFNQVLECSTDLAPLELLVYLKSLEPHLGRTPTFRNGPRVIDIDILLYGSQVVDLPELIIPHPRLAERAFVLVPLAALVPDLVIPGRADSVSECLARVDRAGIKEVYG